MKINNINVHLNNLYKHCQLLIENRHIDELNNNLELLEEILLEILNKSKSPQSSKILKETINICDNIFAEMIKKDFVYEAINFMKKFYQTINKNDNNISIEYSNALNNFLNYVKEERSIIKLSDLPTLSLFDEILDNTYFIDGIFHENGLIHYLGFYYISVNNNAFLSNEDKNYLIEKTYRHLLIWPIYNTCKENPDRLNLIRKIIESLLRRAILLGDNKNFSYFIKKLSKESCFDGNSFNINEVFIKISIYLYYLIDKEELIKDNQKQSIKELLKSNSKLLIYQILDIYDLWEDYYQKTKKEMHNWEYFDYDGEGKYLIMDNVVTEFFYFIELSLNKFRIDYISEQILNKDEMFTFFDRYTTNGNISENTLQSYKSFKNLFELNLGNELEEINYLHSSLMGRYKKLLFDQKRELSATVSLEDFNSKLVKQLNNLINENKFVKTIPVKKVFSKNLDKKNILTLSTPLTFLDSHIESIVDITNKNLNVYIKEILEAKGIQVKQIKYSTINKIKELRKLLYNKSSDKFSVNNLMYGIDENSSFLYSETPEQKLEYRSMLETIPYKQKINNLEWIGLNTDYISIRFSDWDVDVAYYTDDEINKILINYKKDKHYYLNVTNDIFLMFDEDEAREYLKIEKAIIRISIFLEIDIEIEKFAGFIMEVK